MSGFNHTQKTSVVRRTKKAMARTTKMGGVTVVSDALVKQGATNLVPKVHVRNGDMVMVMSGSIKTGKGLTGKVLAVYPEEGKVLVQGVNIQTHGEKQRTVTGERGLIKREGAIYASKVMLYCTQCKKPTRIGHKTLDNKKKVRVCKKCNEVFES